ncbi:MAG: non-hydrolyzing UDP-N-acetylglucosamine 2-epimerase [Bacteroidota bacterium]
MRIVTVLGARPQFIKAAALSWTLRSLPGVEELLVHTGQHYDRDMSDIFFDELDIPRPHYHLGIGSGSHGAQTGRMLEAIEQVLLEVRPDWVLVYGDTNSTLAGALAAVKLHLPVAHVEAGLRSFNRRMPEEINRVLSDHASDRLYAPTQAAVSNLEKEGIPDERIRLVGDIMFDAALRFGEKAGRESTVLQRLAVSPGGYVLATVHRAENTDDLSQLTAIFQGLAEVARDLPVILPLHPRTRRAAAEAGLLDVGSEGLRLVEPLGYLDMIQLEKNAAVVATDSGGVQKEAFFYRVPCVTLRSETEWTELVSLGWNVLAPPDTSVAVARAVRAAIGRKGNEAQPYGDGRAALAILADLRGEKPCGF